MKAEERQKHSLDIIKTLHEMVPDQRDQFIILTTAITVMLALGDPAYDRLLDGLEDKTKFQIASARKRMKEKK